jgi:type II secretory ATPase GspE/PulE/Tfp pilus assembly ATPase PilB-like protein
MINDVAITDGMISLEQDGIIKALNGRTSLEEVYAAAKENA